MNGGNVDVTIWASQMRPGGLPAVCVKTGQPADRWVRRSFSTAPRWTYWLLLAGVLVLGVIPYLIVRAVVSVKATGQLPFTRTVASRLVAFTVGGLAALLVGIILFVVGAAANSGAVAVLGVLLFFLGLVLLVASGRMSPRAVVRKQNEFPNDRVVVLRKVHPKFAEAVSAQQRAGQQPTSWQAPPSTTAT
jgi:membrane-bound ClpP family serine protease